MRWRLGDLIHRARFYSRASRFESGEPLPDIVGQRHPMNSSASSPSGRIEYVLSDCSKGGVGGPIRTEPRDPLKRYSQASSRPSVDKPI